MMKTLIVLVVVLISGCFGSGHENGPLKITVTKLDARGDLLQPVLTVDIQNVASRPLTIRWVSAGGEVDNASKYSVKGNVYIWPNNYSWTGRRDTLASIVGAAFGMMPENTTISRAAIHPNLSLDPWEKISAVIRYRYSPAGHFPDEVFEINPGDFYEPGLGFNFTDGRYDWTLGYNAPCFRTDGVEIVQKDASEIFGRVIHCESYHVVEQHPWTEYRGPGT